MTLFTHAAFTFLLPPISQVHDVTVPVLSQHMLAGRTHASLLQDNIRVCCLAFLPQRICFGFLKLALKHF